MGYESIATHQMMLQDKVRTESFREAIAKVVETGDRVLDFGCGTGILSFFASRSGAARVVAVDESNIVRVAKLVADTNGFENIDFFHESGGEFDLDAPVDVIVSEWMGCFLFHEWMHAPLLSLRNRLLKPGGRMIPRAVSLKMGLVVDPAVTAEHGFFLSGPYEIDYSPVGDWPSFQVSMKNLLPEQILPRTADLGTLDMHRVEELPETFNGRVRLDASSEILGLAGWFEADLCEGVGFGTGPFDAPTHWNQMFFPLSPTLQGAAGDIVEVGVSPYRREGDRATLWRWFASAGGRTVEMDDFVHQAWLDRALPAGRLP